MAKLSPTESKEREKMSEWLTVLQMSMDDPVELREAHGLGFTADAYLDAAIRCYLCGMQPEAVGALDQARALVMEAISADEKPGVYFPGFSEAHLHLNLGLCNWLLYNFHDVSSFENAANYLDQYLASGDLPSSEVEEMLPNYLFVHRFGRVVELYNQVYGEAPPAPSTSLTKSEAAAVVANWYESKVFTREAVEPVRKALGSFLGRALPEMFARGRNVELAIWMKIAADLSGINRSAVDSLLLAKKVISI